MSKASPHGLAYLIPHNPELQHNIEIITANVFLKTIFRQTSLPRLVNGGHWSVKEAGKQSKYPGSEVVLIVSKKVPKSIS